MYPLKRVGCMNKTMKINKHVLLEPIANRIIQISHAFNGIKSFYFFSNINKQIINSPTCFRRHFNSGTYDVFDKLKDVSDKNNSQEDKVEINDKKRKPTKKVLKLVDEILNLTLIEAADLCELCQEKLGDKNFNNSSFLNRTPFPHPSTFFGMQPHMATGYSNTGMVNNVNISSMPPNNQTNINDNNTNEKNKETIKKEEKKKKSTYNIKLETFDVKNKINTIKEIRKITNVGLKEAKDMVESAPFYIQKSVPTEKAEEIKKRFEELGSTIILE
ncbi:mitochondrial ribosomal protein L12, putative [Hepatocystis sp. ex Piliocolobus tephrosceles]|nr:mitochondrial ribosomal protein L12, putative [Hepatocystis sp. ex Piliocolobus tephrosceles]